MTTNPDNVVTHRQLPAVGISAHDIIYVAYSLQCPKMTPKTITYRNFQHIDEVAIIVDVATLTWNIIWTLRTVDGKIEQFNNCIIPLYDTHAPLHSRRVTRPTGPWMTETIRTMMTERDLA